MPELNRRHGTEMNVLLIGANGQLGQTIRRSHPAGWALTALGHAQLDITDAQAVRRQIDILRPALIINAAAYNAVDRAEHERDRAFAVNAQGPLNLAEAANRVGARLVHVSTDYVFDGHARLPYDEQAATNPLNVYGHSKLQGEQLVLKAQPEALVVRTAWVYSTLGASFVAAMLNAAGRRQALRVVNDQTGAPTFAGDLAEAIIQLSRHPKAQGGIYHYSGATALTRHDFARAILEAADCVQPFSLQAREESHAHDNSPSRNRVDLLRPISSGDYPSEAVRPKYSVLDCSKMAALGLPAKPLQQSLPDVVRALLLAMPG